MEHANQTFPHNMAYLFPRFICGFKTLSVNSFLRLRAYFSKQVTRNSQNGCFLPESLSVIAVRVTLVKNDRSQKKSNQRTKPS